MKCKRGFTLIELLVVMAIIALLISILMPALEQVKRTTSVMLCLSHLKAYSTGLTVWSADDTFGQYPPNYNYSATVVWSSGHGADSRTSHMATDPRYSSKYGFLDGASCKTSRMSHGGRVVSAGNW